MKNARHNLSPAFTLIELLVVVAIISLLVSLLVPSLAAARAQARKVVCSSNQRQLAIGALLYAHEANGAMPACGWWRRGAEGYWWGQIKADRVDHTVSPLYKYLRSAPGDNSVFECPEQPIGTYRSQPMSLDNEVTSTYAYNGYYLTPAATPGWSMSIGKRPWQKSESIQMPGQVFMFADGLIVDPNNPAGLPANIALLDPPYLFEGGPLPANPEGNPLNSGRWAVNTSPTTAFRHRGQTVAVSCDGHAEGYSLDGGTMTSARHNIGSVGSGNGPHYIPDWREW